MFSEQKSKSLNLSKAKLILAGVILAFFIIVILSVSNIVNATIIGNGFESILYESPAEQAMKAMNILNWILALMVYASFPIFLVGIYKFFKGKKKEEIKILSFLSKIIFSFISSAVFIFLYFIFILMIISKISIFYNSNNFNMAGWILLILLYIGGIYSFVKWQLEFLKLNFFIIFSFFLFNLVAIIYALTYGVTVGPMLLNR